MAQWDNTSAFQNNTSINQQIDSNLNTATGAVSSALGGLTSSASGVISSAVDMGNKLLGAGSSIINSGLSALEQLGSFTTVTKFADNLKPPAPILQDKPELSRGKTTETGKSLTYPRDLPKQSIQFHFMNTYKASPLVPSKDRPTVTINLPMPADLIDKFNAQYSSKDLGVLGKALQDSSILGDMAKGDFSKEAFGRGGQTLGNQATKENAYAAGRSLIGDNSLTNAADRAFGVTVNPYTALQFQGVGLRKHSFKFRFSPNSRDEARDLQEIIKTFKERMLPEKNGMLFTFPDTCMIKFTTQNTPYSFKTCFLENMTVNYAPSGIPSFFKGGEFTTEVEISLEFGETEVVTRDDLQKSGGDITGSGNPYDSASLKSGAVLESSSSSKTSSSKVTKVPIPRTQNDQGVSGVQTDSGMSFGAGNLSG